MSHNYTPVHSLLGEQVCFFSMCRTFFCIREAEKNMVGVILFFLLNTCVRAEIVQWLCN